MRQGRCFSCNVGVAVWLERVKNLVATYQVYYKWVLAVSKVYKRDWPDGAIFLGSVCARENGVRELGDCTIVMFFVVSFIYSGCISCVRCLCECVYLCVLVVFCLVTL